MTEAGVVYKRTSSGRRCQGRRSWKEQRTRVSRRSSRRLSFGEREPSCTMPQPPHQPLRSHQADANPKLRIQAATPVPTQGLPPNGLPRIVPNTDITLGGGTRSSIMGPPTMPPPPPPSERAGLATSGSGGRIGRAMKSEPGLYGFTSDACSSYQYNGHFRNYRSQPHGSASVSLTNQQIQMNASTPAPSDISSIQNTPRGFFIQPDKMSTSSFSTDHRGSLLMPGQMLKQDTWQYGYKVLPNPPSDQQQQQHSERQTQDSSMFSVSNLSSLLPETSPSDSSFASPHQSARLTKKRAMSTSTLSSEGLDILSMIRSSPTALFHLPGMGGTTSPTGQMGCYGHLSARNSSGSPASAGGSASTKLSFLQSVLDSSNLSFPDCSELQSNMAIVQDFATFPEVEQFFKEEAPDPFSAQPMQHNQCDRVPPIDVNSVGIAPEVTSAMDCHPPPTYHQAIKTQQQQQPTSESHQNGEVEETHACKWIDCQAVFQEQDQLVRHLEKQHIDQRRGDDFTCFWQGCQRRCRPFNARYKLLIHMRVHSGEKPNKCTFEGCTKAFSRLENLKIHLRSHTGERPYQCQHPGCPKAFSNSSDRAKHQRTHVDTYAGCRKEFSRLENLKIHLRWHSGEKPYECQHPDCTKTFTNPSDRSKHQRTHSDPKPYACPVPGCMKRYTDPSSLRKHQKNHDKDSHARKKVRKEGIAEYNTSEPTGTVLKNCLSVQQVKANSSPLEAPDPDAFLDGMHFGPASFYTNNKHSPAATDLTPSALNTSRVDHRLRAGGGYNAAPSGSLVGPSRRVIPPIEGQRHESDMCLMVAKITPSDASMPTPPSYPQDQLSPGEALQSWSSPQPPPQSVPTPSPNDPTAQMTLTDNTQVVSDASGAISSFDRSPRPYLQSTPHEYLQVPTAPPRTNHVNYVPQAGNAPLTNDYASMPCNLQERMSFAQQNGHTFHLPMSLEETLANLPYDAISLKRAISNHSGTSDQSALPSPRTAHDVTIFPTPASLDDQTTPFLQLNRSDGSCSRLSAVSVCGDGKYY